MLKTKFENNVLTAFIEGELDHDSAARIRTKLDGICESIKPKLLNLDFSGVFVLEYLLQSMQQAEVLESADRHV